MASAHASATSLIVGAEDAPPELTFGEQYIWARLTLGYPIARVDRCSLAAQWRALENRTIPAVNLKTMLEDIAASRRKGS